MLVNRLWMFEDLRLHPEIADEELVPPVCILSLPRTGTTKLQRQLGDMGRFRPLPYWQVLMPARVPGRPDGGRDARRAVATHNAGVQMSVERYRQSHTVRPDDPEEELHLLEHTFYPDGHGLTHGNPEYVAWKDAVDPSYAYDELLLMLKYLHWQFYRNDPRPLLLKAPMHLGKEDQLLRTLPPGVRLVSTHRDPKDVIASVCHLIDAARTPYYEDFDRSEFGQFMLRWFAAQVVAHDGWVRANPDYPILNLSFRKVAAESEATAAEVCEFLGRPLSGDEARRVAQWDEDNPRQAWEQRAYSLADSGLSAAVVDEEFACYRARYSDYF